MEIKKLKLKYQKWNYGVTFRNGTKIKDRHFEKLEDAEAFYQQNRRNLNSPILFRFKPESYFQQLLRADFYWMGWRIRLWLLVSIVALMALNAYLWRAL